MFTANGRNYCISIRLLWGSTDVSADMVRDGKNVVILDEGGIGSFTLTSSLLKPCIEGSFTYRDGKKSSRLINLVDIPVVYGYVNFYQVEGAGSKYSAGPVNQYKQESFSEFVIIDSHEVVEDGDDYMVFSFKFTMADAVFFESKMMPYSTFDEYGDEKPFKDVVKALFAASGVKSAFDADSVTVDAKVPFITSPNSTFYDAILYVCRKVFDVGFPNTNGKDFCKVVYNNGERKYEMWRFGDVGTDRMFRAKEGNGYYDNFRYDLAVSIGRDAGDPGCSAEFFSNGDAKDLHSLFGDRTFTDYDYIENRFEDLFDENVDRDFLPHTDFLSARQKTKATVVKKNSSLFKNLEYGSRSSRYRDNGSLYDVFSSVIFSSPYTRVRSPGCIGRYVGNCVAIRFNNAGSSPFRYSSGVYLITGMTHVVEHDGDEWRFTTVMDTFKPFVMADSEKSQAI